MFNFTTQTILNKLSKFNQETNPKGNVVVDFSKGSLKSPSVRLGNLRFDTGSIVSVEKKLPSEEILGSVEFDLKVLEDLFVEDGPTTLSARFALYVGLSQTSADAFYANDLVYKGKPLYVEFPYVKGKDVEAAKKAKKVADQVLVMDGPILRTTVNGGKVKFTCVNGYQIIRTANLQVYDDSIFTIDCCNNEGDFKNIVEAIPAVPAGLFKGNNSSLALSTLLVDNTADTTWVKADGSNFEEDEVKIYPSAEAFGDYEWIMHNLRIPTCANTSYWGLTKQMDELPAANGQYVQYTIRMQRVRDNIAGQVVGERAISVTTHVLYVLNTQDLTILDNALQALKDVYGQNVVIGTSADKELTDSSHVSETPKENIKMEKGATPEVAD